MSQPTFKETPTGPNLSKSKLTSTTPTSTAADETIAGPSRKPTPRTVYEDFHTAHLSITAGSSRSRLSASEGNSQGEAGHTNTQDVERQATPENPSESDAVVVQAFQDPAPVQTRTLRYPERVLSPLDFDLSDVNIMASHPPKVDLSSTQFPSGTKSPERPDLMSGIKSLWGSIKAPGAKLQKLSPGAANIGPQEQQEIELQERNKDLLPSPEAEAYTKLLSSNDSGYYPPEGSRRTNPKAQTLSVCESSPSSTSTSSAMKTQSPTLPWEFVYSEYAHSQGEHAFMRFESKQAFRDKGKGVDRGPEPASRDKGKGVDRGPEPASRDKGKGIDRGPASASRDKGKGASTGQQPSAGNIAHTITSSSMGANSTIDNIVGQYGTRCRRTNVRFTFDDPEEEHDISVQGLRVSISRRPLKHQSPTTTQRKIAFGSGTGPDESLPTLPPFRYQPTQASSSNELGTSQSYGQTRELLSKSSVDLNAARIRGVELMAAALAEVGFANKEDETRFLALKEKALNDPSWSEEVEDTLRSKRERVPLVLRSTNPYRQVTPTRIPAQLPTVYPTSRVPHSVFERGMVRYVQKPSTEMRVALERDVSRALRRQSSFSHGSHESIIRDLGSSGDIGDMRDPFIEDAMGFIDVALMEDGPSNRGHRRQYGFHQQGGIPKTWLGGSQEFERIRIPVNDGGAALVAPSEFQFGLEFALDLESELGDESWVKTRDDDAKDWETVGESDNLSKGMAHGFGQLGMDVGIAGSSVAGISDDEGSMNHFGTNPWASSTDFILQHPAQRDEKADYRIRKIKQSAIPVLLPHYKQQPGNSFPSNTLRFPKPLQERLKAFTFKAPSTAAKAITKAPSTPINKNLITDTTNLPQSAKINTRGVDFSRSPYGQHQTGRAAPNIVPDTTNLPQSAKTRRQQFELRSRRQEQLESCETSGYTLDAIGLGDTASAYPGGIPSTPAPPGARNLVPDTTNLPHSAKTGNHQRELIHRLQQQRSTNFSESPQIQRGQYDQRVRRANFIVPDTTNLPHSAKTHIDRRGLSGHQEQLSNSIISSSRSQRPYRSLTRGQEEQLARDVSRTEPGFSQYESLEAAINSPNRASSAWMNDFGEPGPELGPVYTIPRVPSSLRPASVNSYTHVLNAANAANDADVGRLLGHIDDTSRTVGSSLADTGSVGSSLGVPQQVQPSFKGGSRWMRRNLTPLSRPPRSLFQYQPAAPTTAASPGDPFVQTTPVSPSTTFLPLRRPPGTLYSDLRSRSATVTPFNPRSFGAFSQETPSRADGSADILTSPSQRQPTNQLRHLTLVPEVPVAAPGQFIYRSPLATIKSETWKKMYSQRQLLAIDGGARADEFALSNLTPRLRPRQEASVRTHSVKRRQLLSNIFLLLCCLCWPFLVLYRVGKLDGWAAYWSGGDIGSFAPRQKRWAERLSWGFGVLTMIGIGLGVFAATRNTVKV